MSSPSSLRPEMDHLPLRQKELLVGYRGRLAVANHCERSDQVHRLVAKHFPPPPGSAAQGIVPSLAVALGTPVRTLLQNHTVYPLFAAFPRREALDDDSKSPFSDSYSSAWLRTARPRLALCASCVEEDLDSIHISFWRRDHQVPGTFHCPEHGRELVFTPVPPLLKERPHEALPTAVRGSAGAVSAEADNPVARQSVALLRQLLACGQTVSREEIAQTLQSLAFSGLTARQARRVIGDVSAEVTRQVPADWLADLMPHSKGKSPQRMTFVNAALSSDTSALSAAAVVLLLSLFEVPEMTALSLMAGTAECSDCDPAWRTNKN
jgi:TniQ